MKDEITLREAALLLGVSKVRVRQFYEAGRLPGRKSHGGIIVVGRAAVLSLARYPVGHPKKIRNSG